MKATELTNEELLSDLLIWHIYVTRDPGDEENADRFYELLQEVKRRMASSTQIAIAKQQLNSILRRAKAELERLQEV